MEYHEYANIYRMLPEKELHALSEDIKAKGQLLPITSYEGKILDGRNRYRACQIAGVDPRIEEYTGDDPLGLIASLNDHRRHDTDTERALVGERMASLMHGGQGGKLNSPAGLLKPAVTMARAAELAGTSPSQIKRVRKAKRDGIPELVDMLESGDIAPATADIVSTMPEEDQRKAVSGGVAGVKDAAKKLQATKKKSADSSPPQESLESSQSTPQSNGCDGNSEKPKRTPNYIPTEGMLIWGMAKSQLVRILKNDTQRVQALTECIAYCQERIQSNK
jgi:hypothetical protein